MILLLEIMHCERNLQIGQLSATNLKVALISPKLTVGSQPMTRQVMSTMYNNTNNVSVKTFLPIRRPY